MASSVSNATKGVEKLMYLRIIKQNELVDLKEADKVVLRGNQILFYQAGKYVNGVAFTSSDAAAVVFTALTQGAPDEPLVIHDEAGECEDTGPSAENLIQMAYELANSLPDSENPLKSENPTLRRAFLDDPVGWADYYRDTVRGK